MSDTPVISYKMERTPAQLEALSKARIKAQEARSKNAEIKRKEKAIKLAEKALKASEIDRRYQELLPNPNPPQPEPQVVERVVEAPEEESVDAVETVDAEIETEAPPKKKKVVKRKVVIVQDSESEEEQIEIKLPKQKPVQRENPFMRPMVTFGNHFH